ncbi:hypothetical protein Mapa_005971 [Marchantia paleacea]|nr:hypothetical protein Mapa_005971 [Marchantia paleacea]
MQEQHIRRRWRSPCPGRRGLQMPGCCCCCCDTRRRLGLRLLPSGDQRNLGPITPSLEMGLTAQHLEVQNQSRHVCNSTSPSTSTSKTLQMGYEVSLFALDCRSLSLLERSIDKSSVPQSLLQLLENDSSRCMAKLFLSVW